MRQLDRLLQFAVPLTSLAVKLDTLYGGVAECFDRGALAAFRDKVLLPASTQAVIAACDVGVRAVEARVNVQRFLVTPDPTDPRRPIRLPDGDKRAVADARQRLQLVALSMLAVVGNAAPPSSTASASAGDARPTETVEAARCVVFVALKSGAESGG